MSCSADLQGPGAAELADAASRLLGTRIDDLAPARGGGNNRVYRLRARGELFSLKCYPSRTIDPRDRLGREYGALQFLARHKVREVPRPVAADPKLGLAVYEWIDGVKVAAPSRLDIDDFLGFAARLTRLRAAAGAAGLAPSSAACLSPVSVTAQLAQRLDRLRPAAEQAPDLNAFLEDELGPASRRFTEAARDRLAAAGIAFDGELPPACRCLSPSDFGAHNALRRPDRSLAFIDFEYFGWDDPVKLTADFTLHPGQTLAPALRRRFADGMRRLFAPGDRAFPARLAALRPLFGLCWCLILLNEFLPDGLARRVHATGVRPAAEARARQLARARALLESLRESHDDDIAFA